MSIRESSLPAAAAASLTVSPQVEGVVALPGLPAASPGLVVAVALVETTGLLAGGSEAALLAVLVDGVDDPVDAGVDPDGLVLRVDEDDLEVLVGGVLVDPVRVEDAEVRALAADALLSGRLEGALELELVHTMVGGLAYGSHFTLALSFSGMGPCSYHSTYHRWHPWGRASCGHRGGRECGR